MDWMYLKNKLFSSWWYWGTDDWTGNNRNEEKATPWLSEPQNKISGAKGGSWILKKCENDSLSHEHKEEIELFSQVNWLLSSSILNNNKLIYLKSTQRKFTSGHRTVGGEEEDRNNHGGTKWRTSWRAETWKKIWQKIDIFGVWEWMDGSWLYRSYIYRPMVFRVSRVSVWSWEGRFPDRCFDDISVIF